MRCRGPIRALPHGASSRCAFALACSPRARRSPPDGPPSTTSRSAARTRSTRTTSTARSRRRPAPSSSALFRGVVYDYEVFDRATLQRDLARIERYYRARGYYGAHARAGRVLTTGDRGTCASRSSSRKVSPRSTAALTIDGMDSRAAGDAGSAVATAVRLALPAGAPFDEDQGDALREGGAQGADRRRLRLCDREARHVHRHRAARREHHPHGDARRDGSPRPHHASTASIRTAPVPGRRGSRSAPCGAPSTSRRANPTRPCASTRPARRCSISTSSRP